MDQYQKQVLKYGLDELDYFLEEIPEYELEIIANGNGCLIEFKQDGHIVKSFDLADRHREDIAFWLKSGILVGEGIEARLERLGGLDLSLEALRYRDRSGRISYFYFQNKSAKDRFEWIGSYREIDLSGNFVLSGEFTMMARSKIAAIIAKKQGRVQSAVSMKTDYLIVGSNNSKKWKFQDYGTKIHTALKINDSSAKKIRFIQEKQLVGLLDILGLG